MTQLGEQIRPPRATDQAYIASSWVRSMVGKHARLGPRYGDLGRNVDAVLDRDETRALVRCAAGDADRILAFLVYAEGVGVPLVHYLYTRREEREKGLARALLGHIGIAAATPYVYTCRGPDARHLLNAFKAATYMPLAEFLR